MIFYRICSSKVQKSRLFSRIYHFGGNCCTILTYAGTMFQVGWLNDPDLTKVQILPHLHPSRNVPETGVCVTWQSASLWSDSEQIRSCAINQSGGIVLSRLWSNSLMCYQPKWSCLGWILVNSSTLSGKTIVAGTRVMYSVIVAGTRVM